MKGLMIAAVVVVMGGLSGCGGSNKAVTRGQVSATWTDASDSQTLKFRGLGVPPATASSTTQRMGLARQAAQTEARTQAVAYLKGMRIKGDIQVGDLMLKNSNVHGLVDRVISGLVEERVEWLDDGGCLVIMAIDRKLVEQMIAKTQAYDAPLPGVTTADAH